jgi:hypothetical protein
VLRGIERQVAPKAFLLRRCAGRLHDDLWHTLDACNGRGLRGALGSVADAAEWTEKRIREWGVTTFLSITLPETMELDNNHKVLSRRLSRSSTNTMSEGTEVYTRHQRIRREMKGVACLATGQQCRVS